MLGNADTILGIEGPGFAGWQPRTEDLTALRMPVVLMIARDTLPVYRQVMDWLANQLKIEPITVPGRHAFYSTTARRISPTCFVRFCDAGR